jgi:hypothetical protein
MINEPPTAFPWTHDKMTCTGMTLRDYFAAKAMQGFHANTNSDQLETETYEEYVSDLARCAYQQADAMLKARND